jgi:hypothetical protein
MNDGFGGAMCDRVNVVVMLGNQPPRPGVLLRRDKLPCQSAGPYADRKWQFIPSFAGRDYVVS